MEFAREVGYFRYITRRVLWRIARPAAMRLPTGVSFPTPRDNFFAADCFVTQCNVDWSSEYILAAFLKKFGRNRDFLDVGAHIGYYSCLVSPFVRQVFAFEPDPRNAKPLSEALAGIKNAEHVPFAVSDTSGNLKLSVSDASSLSHLVLDEKAGVEVNTVTIDDFTLERGLDPIAIKMDIEGFEILALQGASNSVKKHAPIFLIEFNQEEGRPNTFEKLNTFLEDHEYMLFAMTRKEVGWTNFVYLFDQYQTEEIRRLSSKMLFLVPKNYREWFELMKVEFAGANNASQRPRAVKAFLKRHSI